MHEKYLDDQLNRPGSVESYLMQLTAVVKNIFREDPVSIQDCKLRFGTEKSEEKQKPQSVDEMIAICLASVGYVRTREELIADGVILDD